MKIENNTPKNLIKLLNQNRITLESYSFRLKANQLNIRTYENK